MNINHLMTGIKNAKAILLTIVGSMIILFGIFHWIYNKHKQVVDRRPFVNITKVIAKQDVKTLTAIGIIKAAQGIDVSSPTSNVVQSINFVSGKDVEAGTVLITLKNDELKATVKEDKVKYQLAKLNAERSQQLVGKGYISRQDADLTISNVREAKARLEHDEALLENTVIKAPFGGTLGISQVNLGQYISAGQVIVSLQDHSKMYVEFSIPEKNSDLIKVNTAIIASSTQSSQYEWRGKTIALGSQLDDNTRSLPVRAELLPPYQSLKPGMFVNVTIVLPEAENKPAIPQSAIVYNPYGNFVYLYEKGGVEQRYITLGQAIGKNIIIEKGLHVGDEVVFEGQQKLYNGTKVQVRGVA
ncbi:efflux RND transporter periplasmic adaptor subunit [Legionella sp. km535]|uniref:efflux RND transporter periplasmic adaptor subunit n=1 Tax=Legionella sp. km535 TaxID=2498107 RepID=UPI000F8E8B50|nr:efflux RND transporter periplasmic adaptor subunit [Legionella sp. km535]RUR19907.1 efflux RND transporter periplasmic adaptor subunit [Legionella sp. km535]